MFFKFFTDHEGSPYFLRRITSRITRITSFQPQRAESAGRGLEAPPNVCPELACPGAPREGGAQGTPLLASAPGGPAKRGPVCEPPPKLKTWDLGPRVRGPRECRTAEACISCVPRTPRPMLTSVGAGPQVPRMSTLDEGCGGRRRCKRESGTEASTKALRGVAGTRGLRKNPKFLFWGVVGMLHQVQGAFRGPGSPRMAFF